MTTIAVHDQRHGIHHLDQLHRRIKNEPETFLQPTIDLQRLTLDAAKAILDPLASEVSQTQVTRRNEQRRKRKRGSDETEDPVLQLRQIYTNGLSVKQVWEQARRVIDATNREIQRELLQQQSIEAVRSQERKDASHDSDQGRTSEIEDDFLNEDEFEEDADLEDGFEDEGLDEEEVTDQDDEDEDEDGEDIEADSDILSSEVEEDADNQKVQDVYAEDPNGLNDGFFSIDDFNKQSQFLEQMDVRGDDDEPSDEDEIDWTADPLTQSFSRPKPGHERGEDEDDEEDEEGPTFGDADLNALDSDEDEDMDAGDLDIGMPSLTNTNEVRYSDFFEPPPKKLSKNKRMRSLPKTQPPKTSLSQSQTRTEENYEADLERAMADVRRDLLDSEDEGDDGESDISDSDGADGKIPKNKNMSTHELQRAQIAAEIRQLEAANIAKKDWTLSGEASAHARPLNSLIEEDLEFERTGKPVPVITAEVSSDIEALIKRRIIAREFDELIRRLPTALGTASETRRGRIEVDDSKPSAGLGEIYEQEHLKATDPSAYAANDKRSNALKKQHSEIDRLWNEVRTQLDVLGNLHFKPKRLEIEVKAIVDKPRIAMEDARPSLNIDGVEDSALAPQEIYKPGDQRSTHKDASENVVLNAKTGTSTSKEEMSREEKLRRRRREKERYKKANASRQVMTLGKSDGSGGGTSGKKGRGAGSVAEQKQVLDDLKRGGVKVIGKGGVVQSVADSVGQKAKRRGKSDKNAKLGGDDDAKARSITGGALKL